MCSLNDIFIVTLTLWYKELLYDSPDGKTQSLLPVLLLSLCVNALTFTSTQSGLSVLLKKEEGKKEASRKLFLFFTLLTAYILKIFAKYAFIEIGRQWVTFNVGESHHRSALVDLMTKPQSLRYVELIL